MRNMILPLMVLAAAATNRLHEPGNKHGGAVLPKYEMRDRSDGSKGGGLKVRS
jgi:hypothetical protein